LKEGFWGGGRTNSRRFPHQKRKNVEKGRKKELNKKISEDRRLKEGSKKRRGFFSNLWKEREGDLTGGNLVIGEGCGGETPRERKTEKKKPTSSKTGSFNRLG